MNHLISIQSVALVFTILLVAWDWARIDAQFKQREARWQELESEEKRCPYCHEAFKDTLSSAARVSCTQCESEHHRDCFEDHGRCAIYACDSEESEEEPKQDVLNMDSASSAG
ncbi:MAG: RING finger protein [Planctomycetota bacterium]|nr:RING finger protein [Planctomycetota bacterium]